MIKKKNGYGTEIAIAIACWLALIWLRTFTYMTNYDGETGVFSFLIAAVITMGMTLFYWFIIKPGDNSTLMSILFDDDMGDFLEEFDDDMEYFLEECDSVCEKRWSILRKSMLGLCVVAFLCLLAFAFEMWTDITVFTDATYINIGFLTINKKYMFDPILFIVFPLWAQIIFRGLREEGYKFKSVFSASLQLMLLSLISYLLFMKLPNIWLIELAMIESIVVISAIKKYAWKQGSGKKGNILALIGVYELFWFTLLSVFHRSGQTFSQYVYGNSWNEYQENVRQLMDGTITFGESSKLLSNHMVLDSLITNKNNYFFSGLYFGGWVAAVVLLALLVVFLIATHRLLGIHARNNRNYLVYTAAWWTLALRIIIGVPYSCAILAMPISLPFANKISIYMDTIAFGLLVWSAIEAKTIDKSFYRERKVLDVFEETEFRVEEYGVEDDLELYKVVQISSGDRTLKCYAETYEEYNALVLEPIDCDEGWVLIVEKNEETGRWHDVEDVSIRAELLLTYIRNNKPDCMEVIE